jgi:glycosyltransferase involved in cell wall biosynthesis
MSPGQSQKRNTGAPVAPERPHIVHVVGTLGAGGVQRLVLGLAASPAGRAYRHSVICLFGTTGSLKTRFPEAGISVGHCGVPWPRTLDVGSYRASRWLRQRLAWAFPYRFARELKRRGADLVHTHVTHRIDLQAQGVIRRARLPMVWTIHGTYRPDGQELESWRRATQLSAERGAITAVAEGLVRDFRQRGLDHPDGIAVTRGGVDLSEYRSPRARDPRWREGRGIEPEAVVFGASGRLVSEKAYEVLVRSAARIVREGANVHVVIAGGGPLRDELQREIEAAGLVGRFHLIGFVEDVPGFLRELDVFVLSSRFEGFPIALVEALAARLPAIATNVGGVMEMVGTSGALVVPAESEDALAEAMKKMLSPALREAYAARGPQIAERFSIDGMARLFSETYDRLLGLPGPAARPERKVNER